MIIKKIVGGISNLIGGINEGIKLSGYSRTAHELRMLSDRQLADIGISRALLEIGANAYPWREEPLSRIIPDNITSLKAKEMESDASMKPKTTKAA